MLTITAGQMKTKDLGLSSPKFAPAGPAFMPHLVHQARQDVAPGGPRRKRDNRVGLRRPADCLPLLLPRLASGHMDRECHAEWERRAGERAPSRRSVLLAPGLRQVALARLMGCSVRHMRGQHS
jgi:hypothetical protein